MPLSLRIARLVDRLGRVPRAYRGVFSTDDGITVLHDLAREGGALEVSVEAGDPQLTGFKEGKRAMFLHIVRQLRWNERDLIKLAEASAEASANDTSEMDAG